MGYKLGCPSFALQDSLLDKMDMACLVVYCLEAALKLIALGAWKGSPHSYFRSPWNWLDFVIVVSSVVGSILSGLDWAQSLRLLRVLRPLRMISRMQEIQAVVNCLIRSIVSISNVLVVAGVIVLVFAILGMSLFSGGFGSCQTIAGGEMHFENTCCADPSDPTSCLEISACDADNCGKERCVGYSSEFGTECFWFTPGFNFDNLWTSLVTLFFAMGNSDLEDMTLLGADMKGPGRQPEINASVRYKIYYI
jgi:hypothetical protein